jgi:hypothetical protein
MEKDWGEHHMAWLYAKMSDGITAKDVNPTVLELVKDSAADSISENEKLQRIAAFQIVAESCNHFDYEVLLKNKHLGDALRQILHSYGQEMQIPHRFLGIHTRVVTKFGRIVQAGGESYSILDGSHEKYLLSKKRAIPSDVGLYVGISNNRQASFGKRDVELMRNGVTVLINNDCSKLASVVYQHSF